VRCGGHTYTYIHTHRQNTNAPSNPPIFFLFPSFLSSLNLTCSESQELRSTVLVMRTRS
jgi:hypothetical protein